MIRRALTKSCLSTLLFLLCVYTIQAQSGEISIDYKVIDPTACNQANGEVHITPLEGIPPFQYSLNGGASFQSDSIFTNLSIGSYILLVRDAQQKFSSFKVIKLKADGAPVIRGIVMADPTQCNQGGTLKILTQEGIGNLQYSIDSGRTFQSNHIFSDVEGGVYHVVVKNEDDSCPASYPPISFAPQSPIVYLDINPITENPNCDTTDGVIILKATGGSEDYLYSIDGGETYQEENTFENLGPASYNIMVKDMVTNCEQTASETVSLVEQNCMDCEEIQINYNKIDADCDTLNGQIVLEVTGGSGNYSYSIDSGQTYQSEATFQALGANSYQAIVKDLGFNCEKTLPQAIVIEEVNCPSCDPIEVQTFLTLPHCDASDGQIELAISGGSGDYSVSYNGNDFQNTNTFSNLEKGSYSFTVRDNIAGCEKTFTTTILDEDCNCSLGIFNNTPLRRSLTACYESVDICLDIPLEQLMGWEILDNGSPYTGGLKPCNIDTMLTYLYFTLPGQGFEGPYQLDRWEVNDSIYTGEFGNIDDLVAMMNELDVQANWERDSATMTIKGGHAEYEYGVLEITQIATGMTGAFQLNSNFIPRGAQLSLDTGRHEIVVIDQETTCRDTLIVEVTCIGCERIELLSNATQNSSDCDSLATFCFSGAGLLDQNSFTITDNGTPYTHTIINCLDLTDAFELVFDTGQHEVIITLTELDCEVVFNLDIGCESMDTIRIEDVIEIGESDTICFEEVLMQEVISITPTCEGDNPAAGFEINNLTNCVIYEGLNIGKDTLCISVCTAPDTCREVVITVTVVDSMMMDTTEMDTICDPLFESSQIEVVITNCNLNGFYCLGIPKSEMSNYNLNINGIDYTNTYADCDVPENASLELPAGTYELILTALSGGCSDTASLQIICQPETVIFEDTIMVNEQDTFCKDTSNFAGTIISIENDCEEESGEFVIFEIDTINNCIYYTGVEAGTEQACVVTCDDQGTCDTTIVIITVPEEEMMDTIYPPIAIDDIDTLETGTTLTINVLENDTTNSTLLTVTIIDQPMNGNAVVNQDMTISYTSTDENCEIVDYFTYELCNPSGCDTAKVELYIECKVFLIHTGFSPNDDGINETFTIDGVEDYPNNTVQIFNRWGNKVFQQKGYKGQWNGTWNNKKLPDGTYFYLFDDGEGTLHSGSLEIKR